MSAKRENYCDPDYSQFQPVWSQVEVSAAKKSPEIKSESKTKPVESRAEAICRVIDKEFQRELSNKEQELEEINKRLEETKKLLAKVRYAVVYNYYNQKHLICSSEEVTAVQKSQQECMTSNPPPGDKPQMAIHPSLKKLLGKRPIDYDEILKQRPTRKAAQNAAEQFQKLNKKAADTKIKMSEAIIKDTTEAAVECKKPRYVPPTSNETIPQMNSARGRNNYRHLLVVGNVSKYIGEEEADLATNVTHKWLIYVSTKTSVPIEQIVSRARFFLHESYKPNDIIEVSSPPFQLSKRGWGEFPVRVQLYFHSHLMQKPLQIYHTLILDKKHTGMQTMGAETIVELWLNIPNTIEEENTKVASSSSSSQTPSPAPAQKISRNPSPTKVSLNKAPKPSPSKPMLSPVPSTSAQAMPQSLSTHHIATAIKQEPILEQKTMNSLPWQNGHQSIPSPQLTPVKMQNPQLTPVKIKTEQPVQMMQPPVVSPVPQLKICDPKIIPKQLIKQPSPLAPVVKGTSKKTYVKCVGKDGKVSLMELVQDEKNPKLFKMVLPSGVQANKVVVPQGMNRTPAPIAIPSSSIRPVNQGLPMKVGTSIINSSIRPQVKPAGAFIDTGNQSQMNRRISLGSIISPLKTSPMNSQHIPKLVSINSPMPSTSTLTRSVSFPTPRPISSQKTHYGQSSVAGIIQKNNKVMVLDSSRMPKVQQQSLLKPQVSLLKPRPQTMCPINHKRITVSNIPGMENRNINVFMPTEVKREANSIHMKAQASCQVKHRYGDELERRFLARKSFNNMTEAVSWLLKELPLVSHLAAHTEFRESFPFVMASDADFNSLLIIKQRSFEWLRAKHIGRLILKHDLLRNRIKWSTKEIVLFGRWFGYTPQSVFNLRKSIKQENEQNVRDIIKSELIQEHLQNDVISFNTKLTKWIDGVEENATKGLIRTIDEQIIVVDDEGDERNSIKKQSSPLKSNGMQLAIENGLDEVMWINEVCRRTQIRFEQEEIVEGVSHRSAELVFATALRSFVEDLLRKCSGKKLRNPIQECSKLEISNDDMLQTISSIQHFDFLTNKNLGIGKPSAS